MDPQRAVGVELQHLAGDGGRDVRVAVAVAAHPAPEHERPRVLAGGRTRRRAPRGRARPAGRARRRGPAAPCTSPSTRASSATVGLSGRSSSVCHSWSTQAPSRSSSAPASSATRHPAQDRQHRLPRRLRRVRGEHRPQLQAGEDGVDLVGIGAAASRCMIRCSGARPGQLAGAVALLGEVGQLEELRERPGQPDGGARVEAGEQRGDGGVVAGRDRRPRSCAPARRAPAAPGRRAARWSARAAWTGAGCRRAGVVLGLGDDAGGGGDGIGGLGT